MEKNGGLFNKLRLFAELKPDDTDMYALGTAGQILMRVVQFSSNLADPVKIAWEPFKGGGFCNAPSQQYLDDLDDYCMGDPRVMASDRKMRRKYHGNPEERLGIPMK